jgi:hypothetical protein
MAAENNRIVSLIHGYLPEEKTIELLIKLDEEIGKKSEDAATKKVLASLRGVVDKPSPPATWWIWLFFYVLVVFHFLMVVAVFSAFFILPFCTSWYVSVPLMTFIFFFSTTRVECQLTNLENGLRKRLGMKRIGGFVGFYFLKPMKYIWKNKHALLRQKQSDIAEDHSVVI